MIYLDNAATTQVYDSSLKFLEKYNKYDYYNPSSVYKEGLSVKNELQTAREELATLINASANEITFTSGATEGNNLILQGLISGNKRQEFVFSAGEHSSVQAVADFIKSKGYTVHFAKLLPSGQVDIEHLKSLINENTSVVSIMHISNETGAINDLKHIVKEVKNINRGVLVHSDGVQAFGKIKINVKDLGVDAYVVSSHKIHGPKGVGAVYIRSGVNVKPLILGGGQEKGLRSGTENVAGILAFVNSAKIINENLEKNYKRAQQLKNNFIDDIKVLKDVKLNSVGDEHSPYILSLSVNGIKSEILIHMLQTKGVLISNGSSCSSNSKRAGNRVLEELGLEKSYIIGSVRVSFSELNTLDEIHLAGTLFVEEVNSLRKMIA
ncbi:MAG: cysteine desulfurase family protein [Spirochaetales bacterium]